MRPVAVSLRSDRPHDDERLIRRLLHSTYSAARFAAHDNSLEGLGLMLGNYNAAAAAGFAFHFVL